MSKWIIPRHQPKSLDSRARSSKNRGKGHKARRDRTEEMRETQRRNNIAFLDLVTRQADPAKASLAARVIGQCARKKRLTAEQAFQCCRSAAMETGRDMYAYRCRWCDAYHLTGHPHPGAKYEISVKGIKTK